MSLLTTLQKRLKSAKKIAVLGVGSLLRGDDCAGVVTAKLLKKNRGKISTRRKMKVFIGETAPENLTGAIRRFGPDHIIMIDAAQLAKPAGTVKLIDVKKATGFSFSTHHLPLKVLGDYLVKDLGCEITVIGVQPRCCDFNVSPSKEIIQSTKVLARTICAAIFSL